MAEQRVSDAELAVLKRRVEVGGPEDGWSLNIMDAVADDLAACRAEAEALGRRAAQLEALRGALRELLEIHEGACWYDHDGFCQEHYSSRPCVVAEARRVLAASGEGA